MSAYAHEKYKKANAFQVGYLRKWSSHEKRQINECNTFTRVLQTPIFIVAFFI